MSRRVLSVAPLSASVARYAVEVPLGHPLGNLAVTRRTGPGIGTHTARLIARQADIDELYVLIEKSLLDALEHVGA